MTNNLCDTDTPDRITGECPYQPCRQNFVAATVEGVGTHFREHLPTDNAPAKLAGETAVQLMASRAKQEETNQ